MSPPDVAFGSMRMAGVSVGRKIARNDKRCVAIGVSESHIDSVVSERIGSRGL